MPTEQLIDPRLVALVDDDNVGNRIFEEEDGDYSEGEEEDGEEEEDDDDDENDCEHDFSTTSSENDEGCYYEDDEDDLGGSSDFSTSGCDSDGDLSSSLGRRSRRGLRRRDGSSISRTKRGDATARRSLHQQQQQQQQRRRPVANKTSSRTHTRTRNSSRTLVRNQTQAQRTPTRAPTRRRTRHTRTRERSLSPSPPPPQQQGRKRRKVRRPERLADWMVPLAQEANFSHQPQSYEGRDDVMVLHISHLTAEQAEEARAVRAEHRRREAGGGVGGSRRQRSRVPKKKCPTCRRPVEPPFRVFSAPSTVSVMCAVCNEEKSIATDCVTLSCGHSCCQRCYGAMVV